MFPILWQIREESCSKHFSTEERSGSSELLDCQHQSLHLRHDNFNEFRDEFFNDVEEMKLKIRKSISGNISVVIPDIQYYDIARYQLHLDNLHTEIFDHEVDRSVSARNVLQQCSIDLVRYIALLNPLLKDTLPSPFPISEWETNKWILGNRVNKLSLSRIPMHNGYIPIATHCLHISNAIKKIIKRCRHISYQGQRRVYVIGDPRLFQLNSQWPADCGYELVVMADGNLMPETVIKKLEKEDKNILRESLVVICFSIKSHVTVRETESCKGHESCKYVLYKELSQHTISQNLSFMVEKVCDDLIQNDIICSPVFSSVLPVNYYNYRNTVAKRHFQNTRHNVANELPSIQKSNYETVTMIKDIHFSTGFLRSLCRRLNVGFLNIADTVVRLNPCSPALGISQNLINGLSLNRNMISKIVDLLVRNLDSFKVLKDLPECNHARSSNIYSRLGTNFKEQDSFRRGHSRSPGTSPQKVRSKVSRSVVSKSRSRSPRARSPYSYQSKYQRRDRSQSPREYSVIDRFRKRSLSHGKDRFRKRSSSRGRDRSRSPKRSRRSKLKRRSRSSSSSSRSRSRGRSKKRKVEAKTTVQR